MEINNLPNPNPLSVPVSFNSNKHNRNKPFHAALTGITQNLPKQHSNPQATASQPISFTLPQSPSLEQLISMEQPVVLNLTDISDNGIDERDADDVIDFLIPFIRSQQELEPHELESLLLSLLLQEFTPDELRRLERALNKLTEFWKTETDAKNGSDMGAMLLKIIDIKLLASKVNHIPLERSTTSQTVLPPNPGLPKVFIGSFNIASVVCNWIHDLEAKKEADREVSPLVRYCGTDDSEARLQAQERVYLKKASEPTQNIALNNPIKTASAGVGLVNNTANYVANQLPLLFPGNTAAAGAANTIGTITTALLPATLAINTAGVLLSTYKSLKGAWKAGKTLGRQDRMEQSMANHPIDEFAKLLNWEENPDHSQSYVFLMEVMDNAIKRNLRFTIAKSSVTYVTSSFAAGSSLGGATLTSMAIMAGGMAYIAWVIPTLVIAVTALPAGIAGLAWYFKKKVECYQSRKLFKETDKTAKILALIKLEIEEIKSKPLTPEAVNKIKSLTDDYNQTHKKLLEQISEFMEETEKEIAREFVTLIADPKFDNDPNTEGLIAYLRERAVGTGIVSEEIFNATIGLVKDLYPNIKRTKADIKIKEKEIENLEKELDKIELYPVNSHGLDLRENAAALEAQIIELKDDLSILKTLQRKNKVIGCTSNIDPEPIKNVLEKAAHELKKINASIKTHKQEVKNKIDTAQLQDLTQKRKEAQKELEDIKKEKKNIEKMCDNLIMWLGMKL